MHATGVDDASSYAVGRESLLLLEYYAKGVEAVADQVFQAA